MVFISENMKITIFIFDILNFLLFRALLLNEWPRADQAAIQKKFLFSKKGKFTLESKNYVDENTNYY